MEIPVGVRVVLENGLAKAIATASLDNNINVVPVSSIGL